MKEKIRKWNRTLLELESGIVLFGVVCQVTTVWFVADRSGYSIGLWLGIIMAMLSGFHMNFVLGRAFDGFEGAVTKQIAKGSIIRYLVIAVVYIAIALSGIGNPIATFVGLMGLKVGAYVQPFTHKFTNWIFHETDPVPQPLIEDEEQTKEEE